MSVDRDTNLSIARPSVVAPDFGYAAPPKRVGVLWKLSFAATAIVVTFYAWQCGSTLLQGRGPADAAVRHFHQELNGAEYEEVAQEADSWGDDWHGQLLRSGTTTDP